MIVPQFMRFYSTPIEEVLAMYSITFFSLSNAMYRLKASEALETAYLQNIDEAGVHELRKQSSGIHGIVQEVRQVKSYKEQ